LALLLLAKEGQYMADSHLPQHQLKAYRVAKELLLAVVAAQVRDAKLRDEALRAAKGACLNCAEGAGRQTRADKARAYIVARGEAAEAAAAVEVAALLGSTSAAHNKAVHELASKLVAMLTALSR
jgi:four helix bundle protein